MELNCLNCGGSFSLDDSKVPEGGGVLICPLCGRKQHFTRRIQPIKQKEGAAQGFRKPMQAFSGFVLRQPVGAESLQPEITPPRPTEEVIAVAAAQIPNGSGAWLVKSPSGLVLEFPASHLLVNWSAVIENPAPYQVSRGGDEWISLEAFLREVRQGSRATQVFKKMTGVPSPDMPTPQGTEDASGAVRKVETRIEPHPSRPTTSTTQFQFKITTERKKIWPRVLLVIIIILGALVAVGAAWYAGLFSNI